MSTEMPSNGIDSPPSVSPTGSHERRPSCARTIAPAPSDKRMKLSAAHLMVLLLTAAGCAVGSGGEEARCTPGDFTSVVYGTDPKMKELLKTQDEAWLADAIQCKAGGYVFLVPRE